MTGDLVELVEAAKSGDRGAFEELVRLTYVDSYTLAFRLTNNGEDAADAVQEAYLRAYRSISSFRGEARFSTWLYRITANCAANQVHKRSKHRHDALGEHDDVIDDVNLWPESHATRGVDRNLLTAALSELPETLRMVVVLKDVYDLPHEAIASELGISQTTAKVRLHRARKRLRDRLVNVEHAEARAV